MPRRPKSSTARSASSRGPFATTIAELAAVYGCSTKHVQEQLAGGAPAKGPKGYDLKAWGAWWRERARYQRLGVTTSGEPGEVETINWRQRADRADALLKEQKLADLMGLYCTREDVERVAARDFTTMRLLLETIPDRCATLVPVEVRDNVIDAVQDALATTLDTMRRALGRWADPDSESPIEDALEILHSHLRKLPQQLAKVVTGPRAKRQVESAARLAAEAIRREIAAAAAGAADEA